jgi:hypothetical protein
MESIDNKEYVTICYEETHNEGNVTSSSNLVLPNDTMESSAENSLYSTKVAKFQPHYLGSGTSMREKSIGLSGYADVTQRSSTRSFQGDELPSEMRELQFVNHNINPSDKRKNWITPTVVVGRDPSSLVMEAEIENLISDLQTVPKLIRNNNSKDRKATPSKCSANTPFPCKNTDGSIIKSRQNTESIFCQNSDESVVSMITEKGSEFSSLYSNVETPDSSFYSAEPSDDSSSIVSESTDTYGGHCNRGEIRHVNTKHQYSSDVLMMNHQPHPDKSKSHVPVVLKAEAMYYNGELQITVRDDRNKCPNNVDLKITVVHGVEKKTVSPKSAAPSVPRCPGTSALDRDIVKHRAMGPPFNTNLQ